MLILKHLLVITFLIYCVSGNELNASVHYQPEQVHLSFGENLRTIVVTWSTKKNTTKSFCEYRSESSDGSQMLIANETSASLFTDRGILKKTQIIHRATLENLIPNATYVYRCGSELGWSDNFKFHVPPESPDWVPSLALYGDTDAGEKSIISDLAKEVQNGTYDAVIHLGNFAYDFHLENGDVGDRFMNRIQPVAANVPYMTCVGNREVAYNFSHYRARFSMPGGTDNFYYSFNMGPIHFIGFSTELYYALKYFKTLIRQYVWLENDLKEANKPENRALRPWIITFGHRQMYCSNLDGDDCINRDNRIRQGVRLGRTRKFGLEKLFYDNGVDVELWSHKHSYERTWPIYNYDIRKGSSEEPYRNPKAPVHLTIGTAGISFGLGLFTKVQPNWSAFRSKTLGYTHLKAFNKTHLSFEHKSEEKDAFWVIKDHHGPYKS